MSDRLPSQEHLSLLIALMTAEDPHLPWATIESWALSSWDRAGRLLEMQRMADDERSEA